MKTIISTLILALMVAGTAHSASEECSSFNDYKVSSVDSIEVSGRLYDGQEYKYEISLQPYKPTEDIRYYGIDGGEPSVTVNEIKVEIDDHQLNFSPRFIRDLSQLCIDCSFIQSCGESYLLFVEGGDGAGSYDAYFYFNKDGVFKREIHTFGKDDKEIVDVIPEK